MKGLANIFETFKSWDGVSNGHSECLEPMWINEGVNKWDQYSFSSQFKPFSCFFPHHMVYKWLPYRALFNYAKHGRVNLMVIHEGWMEKNKLYRLTEWFFLNKVWNLAFYAICDKRARFSRHEITKISILV